MVELKSSQISGLCEAGVGVWGGDVISREMQFLEIRGKGPYRDQGRAGVGTQRALLLGRHLEAEISPLKVSPPRNQRE